MHRMLLGISPELLFFFFLGGGALLACSAHAASFWAWNEPAAFVFRCGWHAAREPGDPVSEVWAGFKSICPR